MKRITLLIFTMLMSVLSWQGMAQDYCVPEGTHESRFIENFSTTGGIENISNLETGFSTEGYGDFTGITLEVNPGDEINFQADIEGGTAGFRIWIDWDQDGTFDTTEEVAYNSTGYSGSHISSFTIPTDASGTTRMRIASHWFSSSGNVDPCQTDFEYGEFEDYTVEVTPLADCTEAIAGTVEGETEMEVCANEPFTLIVTGASDNAEGLLRTWQSSPAGEDTWTNLNVNSFTYTTQVNVPTDFRYYVACDNGDSDSSEVISISINPDASECYCTPEGINPTRYINNFTTTGGIENITNIDSGYSSNGYGDFTEMVLEVDPGEEVNFEVDVQGGGAGFRVWVDWNQDGSFDLPEEIAYSSTGYHESHTGSITIPEDAIPGATRMRIANHWLSTTGDVHPCATSFEYGEFEDYTIIITGEVEDTFPSPYCEIADAESVIVEELTKVTFDETVITNEDTESVLINKTDTVIDVTAGETYTISVEGNTDGDFETNIVAFIDWNQNAILNDEGEVYELGTIANSTGSDGTSVTMDILVPTDAVLGETRIRITKTYFDNLSDPIVTPCGIEFNPFGWGIESGYGQALDFTLNIEAANTEDCTGTPEGGIANVSPESGEINTDYTVSATGFATGSGLTYQWQSNTDGAGWINEGNAEETYAPYMATAPEESGVVVEWRLEVTCTFSEETSYSEIATFTVIEPSLYCTPTLDCSDGDMITNVTFEQIDNTTTCSPNGYGDYTDMTATVGPGNSYPISVTVGDGWVDESVSVWIDFNENGEFDEEEFFYIGTGSGEALAGEIAIPENATNGNYRMRVRVVAGSESYATWDKSCDSEDAFGETEDYTVTVDETLSINDYTISGLKYYPNPMSDVLYITAKENIESVSAYNLLGQKVLSNKHFNNNKLDTRTLPIGTYLLQVMFDNGRLESFKVIKK